MTEPILVVCCNTMTLALLVNEIRNGWLTGCRCKGFYGIVFFGPSSCDS